MTRLFLWHRDSNKVPSSITRSDPVRSRFVVGSHVALVVAAAACASGSAGSSASPSIAEQAASGAIDPSRLEWSGRFKSVQQQLSSIDPRGRNIASGTVLLTAAGDNLTRARVELSGPVEDSQQLHWAIAPGACRSGTIPLLAVNEFPMIEMRRGHGELDQTLPITLPASGNYHVNVYTGDGSDESDVMTCAPLRLELRRN